MDGISSAFDRVTHWCSSRFTQRPAAFATRLHDFNLAEDSGEDADLPQGFRRLQSPDRSRCKIFLLLLGLLVMFVIGFLVGEARHGQPQDKPKDSKGGGAHQEDTEDGVPKLGPAPDTQLFWNNISRILKQKLTSKAFDETLPDFDLPKRSTGSEGDVQLGNRIFQRFQELHMDPWSHTHNVLLPEPDSQRPNRVVFGSTVFEPTGYLAYSPAGQVEGRLVYGNYGRLQDLDILTSNNIEVNGSVLLLRTGKISFAEQLNNAAARGASAVLIYPDTKNYNYNMNTPLYGHVHLGLGDPYSPGFPSFHHSQLPPTRSSGLPKIPAQTITASNATVLLQNIGGPILSTNSSFIGGLKSVVYRLGGQKNVTVEVNNILVTKVARNVFGVIKGFVDSDRAVVLGAQRDAWGKGYTKATVGTAVLMQLAKVVREMVDKDHFRPRRSLVFASWSAGEYGNIGATEWLESYMSSVDRSVFTYISLDGVVMGLGTFVASASPLLYGLLERTMKEVQDPFDRGSLYDMMGKSDWVANVMRPMLMDDPAYPFLAFSGIPSVSFRFISENAESYIYYGTNLDSRDHLNYFTSQRTSKMTARAAQLAGLMALRLTYSQVLEVDTSHFSSVVSAAVSRVYKRILSLNKLGTLKDVDLTWLSQGMGSCIRAAGSITTAIANTDRDNHEACRILNDRIMRMEPAFISSYLSPMETPFRHLLWGRGTHTLASIAETSDMEQLRIQLALATSTLHGCASAMAGDIWDVTEQN